MPTAKRAVPGPSDPYCRPMSGRHDLAEQQTRNQELMAMCLVAAVSGASHSHHTGKGSANDVFDFELGYSDGHVALGEVVAFARQGEHPGNGRGARRRSFYRLHLGPLGS
jgi:hypothetical protein